MCGIAGIIYYDGRPIDPAILSSMTGSIRHRGPDGDGSYFGFGVALGHRRLSIIDIASGAQPMSNVRGDLQIVFNGEIYNFLELKARLKVLGHIFRTNSDTEVILACYEQFGDSFIEQLNGMFAFALWDSRRKRLVLARDRVGEKPLYYFATQHGVVFASELKALLRVPGVPRKVDDAAVDEFFSFGYIPEPNSIYESVKKLPAAHWLVVERGNVSIDRYWAIPNPEPGSYSEADYADEVSAIIEDSVRIRLISDVPVGVFLSGGIDSSAVTGFMARNSAGPVKTFSIRGGDAEFDELPYARAVASEYGTEHYEFDVPAERLDSILPKLTTFFDEPFGDSSMLPTYYVSNLARQHVKVALSGEGGDELFAGYDWQKKYHWARSRWGLLPEWCRKRVLERLLPDSSEPRCRSSRMQSLLRRASIANRLSLGDGPTSYRNLLSGFAPHTKFLIFSRDFYIRCQEQAKRLSFAEAFQSNSPITPLSAALRADFAVYLPGDLLTKVDRMSMANSLEVRCPLLDYRLIELSTRIPDRMKLRHGVSKYILRQAVAKVLPRKIRERRTKRGFSVPVSKWFRGDASAYARSVLLDGTFKGSPFLDRAGIETILRRHESKEYDYGPQIWQLLVFALWSDQHLDA